MSKYFVKLENLIRENNATETQVPLALSTLKIVLTGTEYGYRRDDGVWLAEEKSNKLVMMVEN